MNISMLDIFTKFGQIQMTRFIMGLVKIGKKEGVLTKENIINVIQCI